mgnify:CR=1 FL=1
MKKITRSISLPDFLNERLIDDRENTGLNISAIITNILNQHYQNQLLNKQYKTTKNTGHIIRSVSSSTHK